MSRGGTRLSLGREFSPLSEPPAVLSIKELCSKLGDLGYEDADTPQAETFMDTVGYQRAKQCLLTPNVTLKGAHSLMVLRTLRANKSTSALTKLDEWRRM